MHEVIGSNHIIYAVTKKQRIWIASSQFNIHSRCRINLNLQIHPSLYIISSMFPQGCVSSLIACSAVTATNPDPEKKKQIFANKILFPHTRAYYLELLCSIN